jgi:hypothetical protein
MASVSGIIHIDAECLSAAAFFRLAKIYEFVGVLNLLITWMIP